jgi:hypothetical protein
MSISPCRRDRLSRYRKSSLGLGKRLSAITGLGGLQPSRSNSPDSMSDSRDEGFAPSCDSWEATLTVSYPFTPNSKACVFSTQVKIQQAFVGHTIRLDTLSLKPESVISPSSSSTSSDAPIPHITPTHIRKCQVSPAFAVTSQPTSHASSSSSGDSKSPPRRSPTVNWLESRKFAPIHFP